MKEKLKALDANRIAQLTTQADRIAAELEAQRELDNVCMVVDMVRRRCDLYDVTSVPREEHI